MDGKELLLIEGILASIGSYTPLVILDAFF